MSEPKKLFTIGYGADTPDKFVVRLQSAGLRMVVDVRLRPDRARIAPYKLEKSPDKGIVALLRAADITYLSCVELGNVFSDEKAFPDWGRLYAELLQRAGEMLVGRIANLEGPLCLLCCEKDANDCHRQLIADYLAATQGFAVVHL